MPTLSELLDGGELERWEVELGRQQPRRCLFLVPGARARLEEVPNWVSQHQLEVSPLLQLVALTTRFVAGSALTVDRQIRILRPIGDGIWELKTADVRLFGWFPKYDHFIVTAADEAWHVKQHSLYGGYRAEAVRIRSALALDEPKFVEGDDPNVIISAFSYPQ